MIRQTWCEDAEAVGTYGVGWGGRVEEGRTLILQMTQEEIRRNFQIPHSVFQDLQVLVTACIVSGNKKKGRITVGSVMQSREKILKREPVF